MLVNIPFAKTSSIHNDLGAGDGTRFPQLPPKHVHCYIEEEVPNVEIV